MILILTILVPLVLGLLAAAVVPSNKMKWAALAIVLLDLALSIVAATQFHWAGVEPSKVWIYGSEVATSFQLRTQIPWPLLDQFEISFAVGVDHLSMLMILLTTALGVFAVLCSWTAIDTREREFYLHILLLQTGILLTFSSLDLLLFYIGWELMVLPLYFLIGIWGSKDRLYATIKFVLYTLAGSLMMLLAIIWMYYNGGRTYSFEKLLAMAPGLGWGKAYWPFLGLMIAFLIKVPLWPLHTWLPDAHTEAPTAGSVILAGVLLKTGVYGILRFAIPLFPDAAVAFAPMFCWLSVVAIIYGAMCAIVQKDMKRLVAYSSVSHMGFIILGVFSLNGPGLSGAILQMINHGISTGGLFLAVGMIYERRHTRLMSEMGGLAHSVPVYAALTMVMVLSSVGLPGLNGFVGEFPILLGAMKSQAIIQTAQQDPSSFAAIFGMANYTWLVGALAASGVIFGAVYLLVMYQKVFFGKLENEENKHLADLNMREIGQLVVLSIAALVIGLFPNILLKPINHTTQSVMATVSRPLGLHSVKTPDTFWSGAGAEVAEAETGHKKAAPAAHH